MHELRYLVVALFLFFPLQWQFVCFNCPSEMSIVSYFDSVVLVFNE